MVKYVIAGLIVAIAIYQIAYYARAGFGDRSDFDPFLAMMYSAVARFTF
jgi:hypothetical protein